MKHALVTGAAGFIGSHLVDRLLAEGWQVTGLDNFDPFYDPAVKRANLAAHAAHPCFRFVETDIRDMDALRGKVDGGFDVIVHLAARAGVRPSIRDPLLYQDVNVRGTQNVLELARERSVPQFVFASSSSVYGVNPNLPWREDDHVLLPVSPYAATKVSGELMGHVYSHLYGIRFIALRFFTVYGPRQRPDLAIHKFARLMLEGKPLPVYGDGNTRRDYTYIADAIEGIRAAMEYTTTPYEVINLGHHRPVSLLEMIQALERVSGIKAALEWLPPQAGEVPQTCADISKAQALLAYRPVVDFEDGLSRFFVWLRDRRPMGTKA
ncbi:MAG TPA: NAD-dependent epimerase/dehydratase family protein [Bryobacteraceae bacterium]|nr:NAD-dependent epimerase/dehydratase family protein [Bryobacteraceae bacterium]